MHLLTEIALNIALTTNRYVKHRILLFTLNADTILHEKTTKLHVYFLAADIKKFNF